MWKHSAIFFKGNKNIIGMEIMNEPFAGDTYSDPTLFLPGVAGKKNLARMNEAVAKGIREVDEDAIIFFEPVTWGMIFDGKISGSGYDQVPGGDEYKDRSVFSYHYYCNSFSPNWREYPNRQKFICDKTIGPLVFKAVKNDLEKFGGAAMMTEGMACDDHHQEECINVANMLDEHLFSFTDYGSSQGATLEPSEIQQATWARTYARATTGIPKKMKFDIDSDTKDFEYCYDLDTSIDGVTEVFASTIFHYTAKGGANVVVEGDVKQVESGDDDLLWFEKVDGAKHGSRVCITLTA
jgi:endoglycosylceramidase